MRGPSAEDRAGDCWAGRGGRSDQKMPSEREEEERIERTSKVQNNKKEEGMKRK